jgi:periplasmic protein TonB
MNRTMAIALLSCLGIAGGWSCARERSAKDLPGKESPAREAPQSGAVDEAAQELPEIPVDVMPKVLKASVVYPEEARARGEQGIVYVRALVGKDGKVTKAAVDPKQPASETLGKAAVAAVEQWTFEPGKNAGEPVAVWIVVPVNFKLH